MIQIEVENSTVFRRRIFLHASQLPVNEPIPLALTAWKYFDLGPGDSVGTVDGNFRIGVRVSRIVHGVNPRTVVADASFGDGFRVVITDGAPVLSRTQGSPDRIEIDNQAGAPPAAMDVTLYRDYAPLLNGEIAPQQQLVFARPTRFLCYASMPFDSGEEALALEATVGQVDLGAVDLRVQLVPDGSKVRWKVT